MELHYQHRYGTSTEVMSVCPTQYSGSFVKPQIGFISRVDHQLG